MRQKIARAPIDALCPFSVKANYEHFVFELNLQNLYLVFQTPRDVAVFAFVKRRENN